MKRVFFWLGALALLLPIGGCAFRTAEPTNLSSLKQEIIRYVESGRYQSQLQRVSDRAIAWLEKRSHRTANAGETTSGGVRLAVVFDLDETLLSNLPHMRAMDFGYQPAAWDAWVARGEAPVIEPVREVYRRARRWGIEVILITARHERDRAGTEKNLQAIGVDDYARIFFKPDAAHETAQVFKTNVRRELTQQGFVIVANIGDQPSDLAGGYAERTFKLPAPFYLSP